MSYKEINGIKFFYELRGNTESTETVAFFNGVMASADSWKNQVHLFEKMGYKILLHDFKGQLRSDKPKGPYTFSQHALEAKLLMESLGIGRVHIVGTSYGGEAALRFALDFPQTVKSISVIDSVSELDETLKFFVLGWKELAKQKEGEKFFFGMMPSIYGSSFVKKNMEMLKSRAKAFKEISDSYFDGQIELYDTFLNDVYITDQLSRIDCPVLVVCGEDDILKPPKFSKLIADSVKNSEYVIIPNCGHVAIFEKPNELNSMLLGFISKHI